MPLSGPSAAFFMAALISSLVVSLPRFAVRSTTLPVGTGTRIAIPVSLPFNSGITRPTADAAPVEVGMMFCAAARGRYGSWCGKSWTCLVVRISVNGSHQTRLDTERFVQDLATGARQFVVQLAFEMHFMSFVNLLSFTPITQVRSAPSLLER